MADDLLGYYNRELAYLRKLGAEFAGLHPKIAGRLRMSADAVEDPHVQRLLEGVAFLNARIRGKLDDEFPELTTGLLEHLYPHYLAPIPSMAVVQFLGAPDLAKPFHAPAGTEIVTEALADGRCRFRTTMPVDVWPLDIESAALTGLPLQGPLTPVGAMGVLRISLTCAARTMSFGQLAPDRLRFFLRGTPAEVARVYELIFNNVLAVAAAEGPDDPAPLVLGPAAISPVGFEADEGLLPRAARSAPGYHLLTEYFAFPDKFQFFDIVGLGAKTRGGGGRRLSLYLYLDGLAREAERNISAKSFALGCTPMVNLFRQRAEPIKLTGTVTEYRVAGDHRRPGAIEIYSIDKVSALSPTGETAVFAPLHGLTHAGAARGDSRFWHATRRPAGGGDPADETWLTLVDLEGVASIPHDWSVSVEATCSNRDLTAKPPFDGGIPDFRLARPQPGVAALACLTAPTRPLRRAGRKEAAWRLISHLTLNHLSLIDQDGGPEALREILRLYDVRDAPETRAMIASLVSARATQGTARAPVRTMGVLCRGLDVRVEFDGARASAAGVFLLAAVLERFVAHYASINAFTRFTATLKGQPGVLRAWPPRAGDLALL
jgi:type VI secretion system protein ImpG